MGAALTLARMTEDLIKIRVTVTAEVTDAAVLTEAALAAVAEAEGEADADQVSLAELRAAIPEDPAAAVVTLVDPGAPLTELPGVELVAVDVEVGTDLEGDAAIELP